MSCAAAVRSRVARAQRSAFQHRCVLAPQLARPSRTLAPCAVPWWSPKYEAPVTASEKAPYGAPDATKEPVAEESSDEGRAALAAQVEMVGKNKFVVETLAQKLPSRRAQVTADRLLQLQSVTGFDASSIFSKFLWYLLKDRNFDESAVADLAHLKKELQLSSDDVAAVFRKRCQRIEKKFGNLILPPGGVTEKVLQQKAQGRTFFSKMLYLAESDLLEGSEALPAEDVHAIFGATKEDLEALRIVELQVPDVKQKKGLFGIF